MGAAVSTKYADELSKPQDGSDVTDFDSAKAELVRVRAKLAGAIADQPAVAMAEAIPVVGIATEAAESWASAVFDQFDTNADGKSRFILELRLMRILNHQDGWRLLS